MTTQLKSFVILFLMLNISSATEEISGVNKTKLYVCLNTCAMCVEHWQPGLYNGPRCAKQCMKHKGQRIVDPDCVKLKMFNYDPDVLKEHRKFMKQQAAENSNEY